MIQFMNKMTGEIFDLPTDSPEDVRDAWRVLSEQIKACERAKDKLKPFVDKIIDERGTYEFSDSVFRIVNVQRMTYDKSLMRQVLDADTFDLLLKPDKTAVDNYLKEHIDDLGEASSVLRKGMVADGRPYQQYRLENLK